MSIGALLSQDSFGDFLRMLRIYAGLTQSELAAAVGFSESHISRLERGLRQPVLDDVEAKFVPALGVADEPQLATRLIDLARLARGSKPLSSASLRIDDLNRPLVATIGRDDEIKLLVRRVMDRAGRLVTLLGPPGVGKTQLARSAAAQLAPCFADGVHFIPLAHVHDPDLVITAIASELGIPDAVTSTLDYVTDNLRTKEMLLILDNFEQVVAAADLVATMLKRCVALRIIVTSRERLHLRAEQRQYVLPLDAEDAERLFVQRATMVDPAFRVTEAVAQICAQLDCLPLAIELCAAQCELFTCDDLLVQLTVDPLNVLQDGPRDLPHHQASMRRTLDHSYSLLTAAEQRLFRQLAVFIGGFTTEVVALFGSDVTTLQRLLAKSLIHVAPQSNGKRRFMQLDTVRRYACEQLVQAQELAEADAARNHFLRHIADKSCQVGPEGRAAITQLAEEIYNVRATLRHLLDSDPDSAIALAGQLGEFWYARTLCSEGRQWLDEALTASGEQTLARANALLASCKLALAQSDYHRALAYADDASQLFVAHGDRHGLARVAYNKGWCLRELGSLRAAYYNFNAALRLARDVADQPLELRVLTSLITILTLRNDSPDELTTCLNDCRTLLEVVDDPESRAYWLARRGTHELVSGNAQQARQLLSDAVRLFAELGIKREEAWAHEELGEAQFLLGDAAAALRQYEHAEALFVDGGEQLGLMLLAHHRAHVAWAAGQLDVADQQYHVSLQYFAAHHNARMIARCTAGLGLVASSRHNWQRAATLLSSALIQFQRLPNFLPASEIDLYRQAADEAHVRSGTAIAPLADAMLLAEYALKTV